jgi:hypothetical protein
MVHDHDLIVVLCHEAPYPKIQAIYIILEYFHIVNNANNNAHFLIDIFSHIFDKYLR